MRARKYHAYPDGSCSTDSHGQPALGWGVALIAEDENGDFYFCGWMAASMAQDSALCGLNGNLDSNTAEMLAMCWTLLWAISSGRTFDLHIHTDSMFALGVAQLGQSLASNCILARCLAGLATAAGEKRTVAMSHVHGHDWQPWNELADGLAKFAATTSRTFLDRDLA